MISIIIPTYNEEGQIKDALESIKQQEFEDYEIIVSDSHSEDNTVKITKEYGVKVVQGPKKGPAHAKNLGAEQAEGEILLFLDADAMLPRGALREINKRVKDDVFGGTALIKPKEKGFRYRVLYESTNFLAWLHKKINKLTMGSICLFTKKEAFEKIGGFREDLEFCEDHDLISRLNEKYKDQEGILLNKKVRVSARRIKERGFFKTLGEYIPSTFHYFLFEEVPAEKFEFKSTSELKETSQNK